MNYLSFKTILDIEQSNQIRDQKPCSYDVTDQSTKNVRGRTGKILRTQFGPFEKGIPQSEVILKLKTQTKRAQQSMRARNYCAHHNTRDHWTLRCMNRCADLVAVCLKRDLQCLRPEASGTHLSTQCSGDERRSVDLAQPTLIENRPVVWKH
ncbi:hypothetical protein TNCV_1601521 [Trichonephila clavipes]|nr:hypothetical protein TNCV_1601521 [Trichonephila clavipes]